MSFDTLIKAVRAGKVEEVRAELSKCDDLTSLLEQFTKETCMTPLMLAASRGHVKVMELLVKKGAKLDTMSHADDADSYSDKSALMTAARSNQVEAVKTLIRLGADINLQSKIGSSALLLACKCKSINTEIVNVLLSNGATWVEGSFKSPLRAVIDSDNVEIAKILLKGGATVCYYDLSGACSNGNFAMVEVLLQSCSKDEINKLPDGNNWHSLLMVASSRGDDDIVELLLRHGVDIDAESPAGEYALLLAIERGHVSTVELLLKKGAKVKNSIIKAVQLFSTTPRYIKCGMLPESKAFSIVKLLIDHGADVDCEDSYKTWTPLLIAISKKSLKIVELLVENGADVNLLAGSQRGGPLKVAVEYNQIEIAQLLIDKGADINLKNVDDVTPLMVASTPAMASLLVKHGAKLNEVDNRGKCALMHMVEKEYYEASDVLLEEGADSSLSDDDGKCPASIIKEKYDRLGLNDGRDISVLTMNKKLIEAQRPYLEYMEQMKRGKTILDPFWFNRQLFASKHGAVLAYLCYPPPVNVNPTPSTSQGPQALTAQPPLDVSGSSSVTNPQQLQGIDGSEGSSNSPPPSKKQRKDTPDSANVHETSPASNESTAVMPEFGLKNVFEFLRKDLSPKDYLKLALKLDLSKVDYDKIDLENPKNSDNVLVGIIDLWIKNSAEPNASWEWLKQALLEIQPTLAHKISTPI